MVNKVLSPMNFKGRIVKNKTLQDTIDFSRKEALKEKYPSFIESEFVASSLDYILNATPAEDVFELVHTKTGAMLEHTVKLKHNGKVISKMSDIRRDNNKDIVGYLGAQVLQNLVVSGKAEPRNTKTMQEFQNAVEEEKKELESFIADEKLLRKEFEKRHDIMVNEHKLTRNAISEKKELLYKKMVLESLKYLNDITKS